ncbi:hypothetical protein BDM02DRAFT_1236542 [Thelephora ganbajun]|uniref:Uncharacterized protein n=1 Tax=Thelephora ganbajun TaxID=370292 RepID=A0ACB6Z3H0_THEGA|nr:hypothetical protein BDM02DRAFT_1236542 [Thelephora ganbajun]
MDGLLPSVGRFPSPTNTDLSTWPQRVYTHHTFTSYPNSVSERTIFSRDGRPLIQPRYPPHCAGRVVSTVEYAQPNHFQLSRSGSQGPPLIANQNYNSLEQHSISERGLHSSGTSSPEMRMTMVPQRSYARAGDREKHESIIFKVNGRSGIPARDAIKKIYAGLEGRDDQVFVGKSSVIMLRLEWPGYLPWSRKIRLNDWKKAPQRIKLEKLATEVAKCLERFILVHANKHPDREYLDWRVGPEFIGIDRLVLVALDNVSRGSWQPRVGLLST